MRLVKSQENSDMSMSGSSNILTNCMLQETLKNIEHEMNLRTKTTEAKKYNYCIARAISHKGI